MSQIMLSICKNFGKVLMWTHLKALKLQHGLESCPGDGLLGRLEIHFPYSHVCLGGRFIRAPGNLFSLLPRPFVGDGLLGHSNDFSATRKFLRRRENFRKKVWVDASDFVKNSSKSEPSSSFLSCSSFLLFSKSLDQIGVETNTPLFGEFSRSSQDLYRNPS